MENQKLMFNIGDTVLYTSCDVDGVEKKEEASIKGVHHDDYPNIYYTIGFSGSTREKQTENSRLCLLKAASVDFASPPYNENIIPDEIRTKEHLQTASNGQVRDSFKVTAKSKKKSERPCTCS